LPVKQELSIVNESNVLLTILNACPNTVCHWVTSDPQHISYILKCFASLFDRISAAYFWTTLYVPTGPEKLVHVWKFATRVRYDTEKRSICSIHYL